MSGDSSEVLSEGADDLTLRAEEFDTLRACINVDHNDNFFLVDRPWWMQIGTLSAKQFIKELKRSEWEEMYHHYRGLSEAAGANKPSECQKAKALWAMKAAKDREDEFYD